MFIHNVFLALLGWYCIKIRYYKWQYRKDYYKYAVRATNFNDNNEIGDGNDNNHANVQSLFIAGCKWCLRIKENVRADVSCRIEMTIDDQMQRQLTSSVAQQWTYDQTKKKISQQKFICTLWRCWTTILSKVFVSVFLISGLFVKM